MTRLHLEVQESGIWIRRRGHVEEQCKDIELNSFVTLPQHNAQVRCEDQIYSCDFCLDVAFGHDDLVLLLSVSMGWSRSEMTLDLELTIGSPFSGLSITYSGTHGC